MKRLFTLLFVFCLTVNTIYAQQTTKSDSISLDLLKAPSSPAFNLLGISPSQIDRPTDANAFKVSLQNATNNFSKLPSSYSVEIAPASFLKLKDQTLDKLNATDFKSVFAQSFSISLGSTHGNKFDKETNDSTSFSKVAFGIKFSIVRPKWSEKTEKLFNNLRDAQSAFLNDVSSYVESNKAVKNVKDSIKHYRDNPQKRQVFLDSLQKLTQKIAEGVNEQLKDSVHYNLLKSAATNFLIERKGLFVDFAGGLALDFPTDQFDYSMISKTGAWLTTGYEGGNNGLSALAIFRYLYQPDKIFADAANKLKTDNISTFDGGARLLYNGFEGKFTASFEAIYRSVINKNVINPSWRSVLNLEYNVGNNQKITFAFGKDFDGTIKKDGNLITALNYIIGFGSTKKIAN